MAGGAASDGTLALIFAAELRRRLVEGGEGAVLDMRELGVHSRDGHILLSVPLPLSRLELQVAALVPRRSTPIVVYDGGEEGDGGEGLAARAARRLAALGYGDVRVLSGGTAAWRAAGYELFTGTNVLSKAFGEFVEHAYGTPRLSAREVKRRIDAGEDVVVPDSRPLAEFQAFSIPGGIDCPGAELAYRAPDAVPSPDTLVVVNCAGRTRSIIGAQALINAGLPNRVAALENGTMAWLLEGYVLEEGAARVAPPPSAAGLAKAAAGAAALARRFGVERIDRAALGRFVAEADRRSLYRLDVRSQEEYEAGHLAGARWAPGGQLVQATDQWVGTRGARIVLVDGPDGVRATITASWLIQIGWGEVYVLAESLAPRDIEIGPDHPPLVAAPPAVATVAAAELQRLLLRGAATVLDLDTSLAHAAGRIPGAWFAIRARFARSIARLPGEGPIVIAAPDPAQAAFAAAELAALTPRPVSALAGGTAAWRHAGLPLETGGPARLLDPAEDVWRSPYQMPDRLAAFREYLDWEIGLVAQLERDGTARFRRFPPAA